MTNDNHNLNHTTPGVYITQKSLSFLLTVITVGTLIIGSVTVFNQYTFRIDQLEKQNIELLAQITSLNKKIDVLSTKIIDLTIALNRIEDRNASKDKK